MLWDGLIYGMVGLGAGAPGVALGAGVGTLLNYGFDALAENGRQWREQANASAEVANREKRFQAPVWMQPATWLPPAIYSAVNVVKGFWFLDMIENHPKAGYSKVHVFENIFMNRDLLVSLRNHMRELPHRGPKQPIGRIRHCWRGFSEFLEKKEVQTTTLGLAGAHQSSANFVHWAFQDLFHFDKVFHRLTPRVESALTFVVETFRGLPVTYGLSHWLRSEQGRTMPLPQKFWKARLPLMGDFLWLTGLLLGWQLMVKQVMQQIHDLRHPGDVPLNPLTIRG